MLCELPVLLLRDLAAMDYPRSLDAHQECRGGWLMAKSASIAEGKLGAADADKEFLESKIVCARFYAEQLLPRTGALLKAMQSGGEAVMALSEDQF